MFLDRVTHFVINLGDQGMCRSLKKLKSLIEVPYVAAVKVHVLSFNMILISSPYCVPTPSYPFRGNLGDQVKCRSPKKLKSLMDIPYVAHLKVHTLSYNMILISSPKRVPRPSCPFWEKFGRSGNVSFTEKAKIVN